MAFVEDKYIVLPQHLLLYLVFPQERGDLLYRGDDDFCMAALLQLLEQDAAVCVAVGTVGAEAVILLHRLIVEVLAVHDEDHLVNAVQLGGELRRLERGERFARTRGVPDIASRFL